MKIYSNIIMEKAWTRINDVHAFSINESATDRYIDRLICENLPRELQQYADTSIKDMVANNVITSQALGMGPNDIAEHGNESFKDYIRLNICRDFDIVHGHGPKKYMRGIFRIVITQLGYLGSPDRNSIDNLKRYVMYIMDAAERGSDQDAMNMNGDLNGMSYSMIHNMFAEKCASESILKKTAVSNKNLRGESDYSVESITKHEQCIKYQPYTSWCITYNNPSNYNNYVNGGRRFYIFTKNGYKNIRKKVGKDAPLDEYGLSMISILVDSKGDIEYITTRYNHDYNGEFFNPKPNLVQFFQDVIGMDLYEVCKPYTEEELLEHGELTPGIVEKRLKDGVKYTVIFRGKRNYRTNYTKLKNGYILLYINKSKYNILKDGKLIYDYWFDSVNSKNYKKYDIDDYLVVRYNGKSNYIDANNGYKLVLDDWVDNAHPFYGGAAEIENDGQTYYINKNFNKIDIEGVSEIKTNNSNSSDDICVAALENGKQTYIYPLTGEYVFDKSFDLCFAFCDGVARVALKTGIVNKSGYPIYEYNLIDTDGNILLDEWMDKLDYFSFKNESWVLCEKANMYNLVNKNGEFISDTWYKSQLHYMNGMCLVPDDPDYEPESFLSLQKAPGVKFNYYTEDGSFLSDKWFDSATIAYFYNKGLKYCLVGLNNKYNYINKDGEYLFKTWFDDAETLRRDTRITLKGKMNFFNGTNGKLISDKWFDYVEPFGPTFAIVKNKNKYNFLRRNGDLLLSKWADGLEDFHLGFAVIELNGKFNYVSKTGEILSEKWFDKAKRFRSGYGTVYIGNQKYLIASNGEIVL